MFQSLERPARETATVLDKADLGKAYNDGSRRIPLRGQDAIIPMKFDRHGLTVNEETPPQDIVLKRLNLKEIEFLYQWRLTEFKDAPKACEKAGITLDQAERLAQKLSAFREEDAKVRAFAEIPTSDWIAAKHVENIYSGGPLQESEHKSLAELAKIKGAYKQQQPGNINATINVFNLPKLTPEAEARLKDIANQEAKIIQEAQIVDKRVA